MDRFLNGTFTTEMIWTGLALTGLGLAGASFPIASPCAEPPSREEVEEIAEARMALFRQWLISAVRGGPN